eukprot:945889-Prymnesium_polylepis.1
MYCLWREHATIAASGAPTSTPSSRSAPPPNLRRSSARPVRRARLSRGNTVSSTSQLGGSIGCSAATMSGSSSSHANPCTCTMRSSALPHARACAARGGAARGRIASQATAAAANMEI